MSLSTNDVSDTGDVFSCLIAPPDCVARYTLYPMMSGDVLAVQLSKTLRECDQTGSPKDHIYPIVARLKGFVRESTARCVDKYAVRAVVSIGQYVQRWRIQAGGKEIRTRRITAVGA